MSIAPITSLPAPPLRSQDEDVFVATAEAWMIALGTMGTELQTFADQANDLAVSMDSVVGGTAFALKYTFSTTTSDSDPGPGFLRLSSATQNAATVIRIDLLGAEGTDWSALIDTFDDSTSSLKGQIKLTKVGDPTKWLAFTLSTVATPAGYRNLTVTCIDSSATNPFTSGDSLSLTFTRNGDKGDAGSGGIPDLARVTRTSNTVITVADKGKTFEVTSGTFSQTFSANTSLLTGWWCYYRNTGTGVVTLDANASELIDGATTKVLITDVLYLIHSDGTSLYTLEVQTPVGDHVVVVTTGNGNGSTNNKIRRFTTTQLNTGSAITYADSATLGGTFTINETGIYFISFMDWGGGSNIGISVNSAQLTTSVVAITAADRLAYATASSDTQAASVTVRLARGDVIRAHTDGATTSVSAVEVVFRICKVGV